MSEPLVLRVARVPSPMGELLVAADEDARVRVVHFEPFDGDITSWLRRVCRVRAVEVRWDADPAGCVSALEAYFAGELDAIDAVRVAPTGTAFQRQVWDALRRIPCGSTTTYGTLARELGMPNASRAVGLANGSNPIAVVVPCHRVIGARGALTGYGGGLDRKRWLLAHEARASRSTLF